MCPEIDYVFTTLKSTTTTATTPSDCICYYQLRAYDVNSSKKFTKISPTTTTAATITTQATSSSLSSASASATTSTASTLRRFSINFRPNFFRHIFLLYTTLLVLSQHCLLGVCAAPQSCVLCDINDLKANAKASHSSNYEEFLFEHQVTRQDAIMALRLLNDSYYEGPSPELFCKSVTCTKTVMKYCLSPQFINDHCWCELGHTDEGLPFIPHICYVGENSYSPSVGSCFFYEEVKECCCSPALAKQWRHISLASINKVSPLLLILLLSLQAGLWRGSF